MQSNYSKRRQSAWKAALEPKKSIMDLPGSKPGLRKMRSCGFYLEYIPQML